MPSVCLPGGGLGRAVWEVRGKKMGTCESCPGQGLLLLPCYEQTAEPWGPVAIRDGWERCRLGCSLALKNQQRVGARRRSFPCVRLLVPSPVWLSRWQAWAWVHPRVAVLCCLIPPQVLALPTPGFLQAQPAEPRSVVPRCL